MPRLGTVRVITQKTFVEKNQSLTMMNNSPSVQDSLAESDSSSGNQTHTQEMKYGERQIAEGQLITFPNPRVGSTLR